MDTNYDQIQAGWSALGSDGDKIGDIEEVGQNYLLVTKGLIFPKDLYIPQSAIGHVDTDEGQVHLNVEKSQVDDMGWNEPPQAGDWATGGVAGGGSAVMNNDVTTGETTGAVDSGGYTSDYGSTGGAEYATGTTGTTDYATTSTTSTTGSTEYSTGETDYGTETSGDTLRVPVHQEELRAERTAQTTGEVRVDKDIVEEQRTLDVPVTREEVEIRRVPVDSTARADDTAFTGGDTIRVPVSAEQVQVSKEARVVEEIEISKRPVTETQTITDTVRREQVNVDETGGVLGGSGTTRTAGNEAYVGSGSAGVHDTGYTGDAGYTGDDRGDRSRGREVGAEAAGAGGGALGGAAIGGVVGGPPGAIIGGVVGAAGGALAGESAEGGDEKGGAAAGGGAGAIAGAVVGGVVGGPPGAVVGGAVGAGAGSGIGDQAQEGDDDETTRR